MQKYFELVCPSKIIALQVRHSDSDFERLLMCAKGKALLDMFANGDSGCPSPDTDSIMLSFNSDEGECDCDCSDDAYECQECGQITYVSDKHMTVWCEDKENEIPCLDIDCLRKRFRDYITEVLAI